MINSMGNGSRSSATITSYTEQYLLEQHEQVSVSQRMGRRSADGRFSKVERLQADGSFRHSLARNIKDRGSETQYEGEHVNIEDEQYLFLSLSLA